MASRRVLSHLLRSTSRRSKPAAFSSPRTPSRAPLSRPNLAGFFLSRVVQYATNAAAAEPAKPPVSPSASPSGKITDELTGAGSIGKVCHVNGLIVDVRFDEGMPPLWTALEVLDNSFRSELEVVLHLGDNMVRTFQMYGINKHPVMGQRVLNTGSPFVIRYSEREEYIVRELMEQFKNSRWKFNTKIDTLDVSEDVELPPRFQNKPVSNVAVSMGVELEKHYDAAIADGSDESTATTQPAFATFKHATRLGLDPPKGSISARRDTYTAQLQEQIQTLTQELVKMRQQLDTMRQQWEADRARLANLKARQREIEQFMADYMARGGNDDA